MHKLTKFIAASVLLASMGLAQKTIVMAVTGDVDTFDPAFSVGSIPTQTVAANVFEPLITPKIVDKKTANGTPYKGVDMNTLVGLVAESWSFDPKDPNTVIFKIRKGIKYTSGNPVTADDVVSGMQRVFDSQSITTFLVGMGGAVTDWKQFKKIDDYTVALTMKKGNLLTLKNMTIYNSAAVDSTQVKANATAKDPFALDWFKKNQGAGTGPYIFQSYTPGDRIVLKANPNYHMGKPKVDQVILKVVPDPAQRVLLLKSGEVDIADKVPVRELDGLKANPNLQVLSFPSTDQDRLMMNNSIAPFNNKLVRQAVAYAIPYDLIVKQVYLGYARESAGPIEEGMPTSDESAWKYRTDLNKAKQLLAQAGFPEGRNLPAIKLSVQIGVDEWEREAVIIQDALSRIGMRVTIEKLPFATFNEQQQAGKLQLFIDQWISWVNDPYYHMFWNFYSGSPSNYVRYKNAEVDRIIDTQMLGTDLKARDAASVQAQKLISEDVPHVYLVSKNFNVVVSKKISGYVYMNDTLTRFYYMDKQP